MGKKAKNFGKIGEIVNRTHSSVQRVISNYKSTGILVTVSQLAKDVEVNFKKPISVDAV